jgi:hypothetical protein
VRREIEGKFWNQSLMRHNMQSCVPPMAILRSARRYVLMLRQQQETMCATEPRNQMFISSLQGEHIPQEKKMPVLTKRNECWLTVKRGNVSRFRVRKDRQVCRVSYFQGLFHPGTHGVSIIRGNACREGHTSTCQMSKPVSTVFWADALAQTQVKAALVCRDRHDHE